MAFRPVTDCSKRLADDALAAITSVAGTHTKTCEPLENLEPLLTIINDKL